MLPASYGNPGPRYRTSLALPPGPRRVVDDGERPRFYVAPIGRAGTAKIHPGGSLRRARRILVVKLDFIGDWVLTTPFLESLRKNAPRAAITTIVLDRVFGLAETCPFVDRTVSVSRADQRRVVFAAANVEALAGFRSDYLGGRFDLALVPRWDADFNGALQIAFGSRAPHVVGFSERSMARRGSLNRGDDRFHTHAVVDRRMVHEADRDVALIEALGGTAASAATRVDLVEADMKAADRFLGDALKRTERFLAVAPFGSRAKTTLPPEQLARIVRRLADRYDIGVVVVGGLREADRAAAFAGAAGPRAVSAAGPFAIRASAALLARASAFIGMDSGPAHVAAAVGTPVAVLSCHPVGAHPSHANAPERFAPRGGAGNVLVIRPERPMPPCADGCEAETAHCILALDESVLWAQLAGFVQAALGERASRADGTRKPRPPRRRSPDGEAARP